MIDVEKIEAKIRTMIADGQAEGAAGILMDAWTDCQGDGPDPLRALLEELSEISPTAAYLKALHLVGPDPAAAERLFEKALDSQRAGVPAAACMALSSLSLMQNDDANALRYLTEAAEKHMPDAAVFLAKAHIEGRMGLKPDVDKAVDVLKRACSYSSSAKVELARMVIDRTISDSDIDPFKLLAEAAVQGNEQSMVMMMELGSSMIAAEDDLDEILPYVVVPDGMTRPTMVRDAFLNEFDFDHGNAEETTAALYGYEDWEALSEAANDPNSTKGKFDEQLEPAEFNDRVRSLASVVRSHIDVEEYVADIIVELLKPTASTGRPSLKRLRDRVEKTAFRMGTGAIDNGMQAIVDSIGVGGDFGAALRTATPARADVWLEMMEEHLGWSFEEKDDDADEDGAWIGRTVSDQGERYEVFISRASFTPGDKGDEHVFGIQKRIEANASHAVLVFNKPLVHLIPSRQDFGVLFGGLLLREGKWSEFVVRPGGGIDDAIAQNLHINSDMNPADVEPYAFEGAGSMGRCIACYGDDIDPGEEIGYVAFGSLNGWTNFVKKEVAELMRMLHSDGGQSIH